MDKLHLTTNQKELFSTARMDQSARTQLDTLLKQSPDTEAKTSIVAQLFEDYPLLGGIPKDSPLLTPLINLRSNLNRTVEELSNRERRPIHYKDLMDVLETTPNLTEKNSRDRSPLSVLKDQITRNLRGHFPTDGRDGETGKQVYEACATELGYIRLLEYVRRIGGLNEFYKTPAVAQVTRQTLNRRLRNPVMKGGELYQGEYRWDKGVREPYNDYLGADLTEAVAKRFQKQDQVNVLDSGCGTCDALIDLVEELRGRFGDYAVTEEKGEKIIAYKNGKRLRLTGIGRENERPKDSPATKLVNIVVGDVENIPLTGPYDEIWDVLGPFTHVPGKKELLEGKYYPLLRREGAGGQAGTMRVYAQSFNIVSDNGADDPSVLLGSKADGVKVAVTDRVRRTLTRLERNGQNPQRGRSGYRMARTQSELPVPVLEISRSADSLSLPLREVFVGKDVNLSGAVATFYRLAED